MAVASMEEKAVDVKQRKRFVQLLLPGTCLNEEMHTVQGDMYTAWQRFYS